MAIEFLIDRFREHASQEALVWRDHPYSYDWFVGAVHGHQKMLETEGVPRGAVVALEADFSPNSVALFLALVEHGAVLVPLTDTLGDERKERFREIAEVEYRLTVVAANDTVEVERTGREACHEFLRRLKREGHPGLILFSSGSTGESKASVHDFVPLLEKFKTPRQSKRMLTFLLFDHIGGVNTMLYVLSNAGCIVTVEERTPEAVCSAIQKHRAQVLPTSPTFLNLLLLSEAYKNFDLSSLELMTYGTEVMPESTLKRLATVFPQVKLQQTYGLSEVGILRSKSKSSDSLWVKIGGEGFETRVRDGLLEIKAQSAMLGYLNAPSPFTEDGWFMTGDAVEVDGEYMRILGRRSEIINVGGEKVYPAEVESVLLLMEGVEDAAVRAEKNPITGNMVVAKVRLSSGEDLSAFRKRMREFCTGKLERFKVPQKIELVTEAIHGARFKKKRT